VSHEDTDDANAAAWAQAELEERERWERGSWERHRAQVAELREIIDNNRRALQRLIKESFR